MLLFQNQCWDGVYFGWRLPFLVCKTDPHRTYHSWILTADSESHYKSTIVTISGVDFDSEETTILWELCLKHFLISLYFNRSLTDAFGVIPPEIGLLTGVTEMWVIINENDQPLYSKACNLQCHHWEIIDRNDPYWNRCLDIHRTHVPPHISESIWRWWLMIDLFRTITSTSLQDSIPTQIGLLTLLTLLWVTSSKLFILSLLQVPWPKHIFECDPFTIWYPHFTYNVVSNSTLPQVCIWRVWPMHRCFRSLEGNSFDGSIPTHLGNLAALNSM